ncbi:hypothetical protein N1031_10965 [Herbiconiux moechotypicola]|uniref:hypothetical protein n=1 Tax=Herbiconiux moechotypicola TaxID=637393 RepID=UPI00217DCAA5|nr:hypothetical protein [Herbiconiux moechotypicola]MCS5730282.1 hypothetical protein [Herbiconiux moechotypicola]
MPESLYEVAFREAITLVVGARPVSVPSAVQGRATVSSDAPDEAAANGGEIDTEALIRTFAEESGVDVAELVEVFYFESDGSAHLNVSGRKLGESTAAKAKAVATAIAAAYHFADDEPTVSVEVIRAECVRLKCFDKKNFFTHMGAAPGTVLSGSGSSRVLRIKSNEIKAALQGVVTVARGTKE